MNGINALKAMALYAAATLLLFLDCAMMEYPYGYTVNMLPFMLLLLLPVVVISLLAVLLCVLLWKPKKLPVSDIFGFVICNASLSYIVFAAALLPVILYWMLF